MSEEIQESQGAPDYPGAPWAFRRAVTQGKNLITPWWGLGDVLITLGLTSVIALAVSIILVSSKIDPTNGWGLIVATSIPWIGLAGWPIYAAWRKGNGLRLDFGFLATRAQIRMGLFGGLVAVTVGLVLAKLSENFFGDISSTAGDLALDQNGLVLLVFALMIMFGAPVVEEIAFRGLLFSALVKARISAVAAVFISAAVFAMFHFEPSRILILFAIGLVLGEIRRRTGSTLASVATHFMVNAPATIAILVTSLGFGQ
jgi:membrane protease YdiL (CAAX protease family)